MPLFSHGGQQGHEKIQHGHGAAGQQEDHEDGTVTGQVHTVDQAEKGQAQEISAQQQGRVHGHRGKGQPADEGPQFRDSPVLPEDADFFQHRVEDEGAQKGDHEGRHDDDVEAGLNLLRHQAVHDVLGRVAQVHVGDHGQAQGQAFRQQGPGEVLLCGWCFLPESGQHESVHEDAEHKGEGRVQGAGEHQVPGEEVAKGKAQDEDRVADRQDL